MNAVDKRTWLAERGLAKPGARGKFSTAAHEALAQAETGGVVFIDKKVNTATVTVIGDDGERSQEVREVNPYAPTPDPIRTNDTYPFKGADGKVTKVSVTEACHGCSHSLGWCYCAEPTFLYWKTGEILRLAN